MKEARPVVDTPFSAVLLAGGKSTRMGFDKATCIIEGLPLWKRQLQTLQSLGAAEIFISGSATGPWQGNGVTVIEDEIPFAGPMGALLGILQKISTERVLVLAVDMPRMTSEFLIELLKTSGAVVPRNGAYFEPLAAIYAQSGLDLLKTFLQTERRSLQEYLRASVDSGTIKIYEIRPTELRLFANFNEPVMLKSATFEISNSS